MQPAYRGALPQLDRHAPGRAGAADMNLAWLMGTVCTAMVAMAFGAIGTVANASIAGGANLAILALLSRQTRPLVLGEAAA